SAYVPVFEDWLFHVLLPLTAYGVLTASTRSAPSRTCARPCSGWRERCCCSSSSGFTTPGTPWRTTSSPGSHDAPRGPRHAGRRCDDRDDSGTRPPQLPSERSHPRLLALLGAHAGPALPLGARRRRRRSARVFGYGPRAVSWVLPGLA